MTSFEYRDTAYPVRDDLKRAHRDYWETLAKPGSWWTGEQRVAIAREVRGASGCRLCAERRDALSPLAVDGRHDTNGDLPDPAIDAVHRIATDASRLSRSWLEKLQTDGLSDAAYVELLGVVVSVISIDSFHRALDFPLEPLPESVPGAPDLYRPATAVPGAAWVPWIPAGKGKGTEADLYPMGGRAPNVFCAMSLVPGAVRSMSMLSRAQYIDIHLVADPTASDPNRALDRPQIELLAGRVSAINECFY